MRLSRVKIAGAVAVLGAVGVTAAAVAGDRSGLRDRPQRIRGGARRSRRPAAASFEARRSTAPGQRSSTSCATSAWRAPSPQAHIHFGQEAVAGGISAFLCTNQGNGPAGTQACPPAPATISGTIRAADVIGPAGQGIAAGEFGELVRAMRAGVTYANVHSALVPGGEIRGQIDKERGHDD